MEYALILVDMDESWLIWTITAIIFIGKMDHNRIHLWINLDSHGFASVGGPLNIAIHQPVAIRFWRGLKSHRSQSAPVELHGNSSRAGWWCNTQFHSFEHRVCCRLNQKNADDMSGLSNKLHQLHLYIYIFKVCRPNATGPFNYPFWLGTWHDCVAPFICFCWWYPPQLAGKDSL